MRNFITGILFFILCTPGVSGQDRLLDLLKREMSHQMQELQQQELPPYYMNYRMVDEYATRITTAFGVLMDDTYKHERTLVPQIRIGSKEFDNFKKRAMGCKITFWEGPSYAVLPLDENNNENAIRQAIWQEVNSRYKFAVEMYQQAKASMKINVEEDDKSPCFSEAPVETYYEKPLPEAQLHIDREAWIKRLKEISAVFQNQPKLLEGEAYLQYIVKRIYFIDTDGTAVVQNQTRARILVSGMTKADDGMKLPLSLSYFAYCPEDLPSNEQIIAETQQLVKKLLELREAPIVEPYTGPAILSGASGGVFFHEIFGHRIEGQRMKEEDDAQTFKTMVGKPVLPADMQVYADPTLKEYAGEKLNGHYKYDDQGVKAQRVDVVVDGKLNEFLMTRTPLDGHPRSNGHARAALGYDPTSRQSNLIVETKDPKSEAELRRMLIAEARAQGKECGYFFKEVTGGFTMTGRMMANSFNVIPVEVYEIYVDGRPDRLVRGVDLIGTPLSMFSNIIHAGGESQVFTGTCGADSGGVPVTATSPTILVKKVEMQKQDKSADLPPILEKPLK